MLEILLNYGKKVLLMFSMKNDRSLLKEIGFSGRDVNRFYLEFKIILTGQFGE